MLITKTPSNITIDTLGQNISLTLACRQQATVIVQLSYSDADNSTSSVVGLIVGLGLGIPLAIFAMLMVIFCIFCRQRSHNNGVAKNALVN
jgi:hypothetical protein